MSIFRLIVVIVVGAGLMAWRLLVGRSQLIITSDKLLFPTVSGFNLDRQELEFPRDFAGELNLIFIAFLQQQQLVVNTWLPYAQEVEGTFPGVVMNFQPSRNCRRSRAPLLTRGCGRAFPTQRLVSAPLPCTLTWKNSCKPPVSRIGARFISCWSTARVRFCGAQPAISSRSKGMNWLKRLKTQRGMSRERGNLLLDLCAC